MRSFNSFCLKKEKNVFNVQIQINTNTNTNTQKKYMYLFFKLWIKVTRELNLGLFCVIGQGVEQSNETAREWLMKAAEQGEEHMPSDTLSE